MKYIVNRTWGGFRLPSEYCALRECTPYDYIEEDRTDPVLIKIVEEGCDNPDLEVVDIPENATDWELQEYDGQENIICVIDGKIRHI